MQHPNIQRVYDLVESKGRVAVQLEYLDGQSLSKLRLTKPNQVFEVRDLEKWTGELCGALEYAHQEVGLTDIDIAPGNLIIDPAGNLKVKDVGITNCIADSMSRLIAMDEPDKTLPYQSPQRAAGEKPAVTDDLYSLGALLYELLTSKPPFDSGDYGCSGGRKASPFDEPAKSRAWDSRRGHSRKLGGDGGCLLGKRSFPSSPDCERSRKAIEEHQQSYSESTASSSNSVYPQEVADNRSPYSYPGGGIGGRLLCASPAD